ncbi:MAG: 50S ribosomal protein L13 [Desulfovibrio sp.]|nr:MAG: 50S ribosomal protein L13 [Desulfovibrio sp.]
MKTYIPKESEISRDWFVVDAEDQILGRLASQIANRLRGKHKADFTPHLDLGDFIVVVNADKIKVTGKKLSDKMYHNYSGYPGGLRSRSLSDMLEAKPDEVIRIAVRGMLPRTRLGRAMLKKLKVYAGPEHPHNAQEPKPLAFNG